MYEMKNSTYIIHCEGPVIIFDDVQLALFIETAVIEIKAVEGK